MEKENNKTTKLYNFGGYEQIVKYNPESKEIYFIDCTCGDFSGVYTPRKEITKICSKKHLCEECKKLNNIEGCGEEFLVIKNATWFPGRRLYKDGVFSNKRFYAKPCKHLKPIIKCAEMQGLKLKVPRIMEGTDKCTPELRKKIFERSNGICEMIGCTRPGKEIHREIPGVDGGKYNEWNCKLLCLDCHQNVTYQPWQDSPGAKHV